MIHHITAEDLGCISVLRSLGCKDLVTVFAGYNAEAEKAKMQNDQLDKVMMENKMTFIQAMRWLSAVAATLDAD